MATLSTNDTISLPGVVVFVDTETFPENDPAKPGRQIHRLMLGCATAGRIEGGRLTRRRECDFDSRNEFWEFCQSVSRPEKPVWIFAHNLSFDLSALGIWQLIDSGRFRLTRRRLNSPLGARRSTGEDPAARIEKGLFVSEDPPTILMGWLDGAVKCWCLDTLNWWPIPLAKLGALVGLAKGRIPAPDDCRDSWRSYCRRDVQIIESAVCRWAHWQRKQELGRFAFTMAGQSMAGFRHRWMRHDIAMPDSQEQRDAERDGNYTGRTEALFCGHAGFSGGRQPGDEDTQGDLFRPPPRGPFRLLDAYSFYGSLLLETAVPIRTVRIEDRRDGGSVAVDSLTRNCCARVLIRSDFERFPTRTPRGVIWPIGEYWSTLHGAELLRAIETGSVADCNYAVWYETAVVFDSMISDLAEELRQSLASGDRLIAASIKLMMARIAGKFSQQNSEWMLAKEITAPEPWAVWSSIDAETREITHYRAIGVDVERRQKPEDAEICWPAITAFITAAGRERLLRWMRVAGDGNVLYVATDSLIVTDAGYRNLDRAGFVANDTLGFLRVQETADTVNIRGPGSYQIGALNRHMGRDVKGVDIGGGMFRALRFPGMRAMMQRCGEDGIPVDTVVSLLPERLPVGTVRADGWIDPVILANGE